MIYPGKDLPTDDGSLTHCAALETCATRHCLGKTSDALCIFLQTHLCICKRKSSSSQDGELLKALNQAFAAKMVEVYACFERRRDREEVDKLSRLWVVALNSYLDGERAVIVLARLAAAHILGDLEHVLFLNPISRQDYEAVYDDIVDCVATVSQGSVNRDDFLDLVFQRMQPILDPARKFVIGKMRALAWDQYQQRLRLSQR